MAKIFSSISKSSTTLSQRYNDSGVNNDLTTFKALRNTVSGDLVPSQLLVTNRPKKVYDTYTDPRLISLPLVQEYRESQLIEKSIVTRVRRSGFYDAFRNASTSQTTTNDAKNNTLIEIKPYTKDGANETYSVETSRMLENSQALPLISGPRDVRRMNRYLSSSEGTRFKLTQQVLQSGNTFGQTRSYNPVSVETMILNLSTASLLNPLARVSRLVEGTAVRDSRLRGRLQKETVIDLQSKLPLKFIGGASPAAGGGIGSAISGFVNASVANTLNNSSINIFGRTINIGQINNALNTVRTAAEVARRALNINDATLAKDQTAYDALYEKNLWPLIKNNDGTVDNFENRKKAYLDRARSALQALKGTDINNLNKFTDPYPTDDYRSSADYDESVKAGNSAVSRGTGIISARYLRDPLNLNGTFANGSGVPIRSLQDLKTTADSNSSNKDYVTFKIRVPGVPELETGIKFRAFINDFNHTSKGQYDEVRYVGRPERFMTYKGMNRSSTFSMYLVAFSEAELSGMWLRCDMLNKLVFPIKDLGGYMMPPITILTIGNVLVDQPGYVENVDMKLTDIPWDIDSELPMAIQLTLSFNIIENSFITQQGDSANLFNYLSANTLASRNGPPTPRPSATTTRPINPTAPITSVPPNASRPLPRPVNVTYNPEAAAANAAARAAVAGLGTSFGGAAANRGP